MYQTRFYLRLIGICLLVNLCSAASTFGNGRVSSGDVHKHSGSDLDVVQCNHAVYRVPPNGGKPELVNGQESRVNAKQYLPPPGSPSPPKEEDPAASFDQPNFLTVEHTFVSPNLQKNYKTLFGQKKPEVVPAAAQNVPSRIVPDAPRKVNDKKHSHDDDDENNLERLCNDAFHSFLCKPIKGPRKTPTGRLRENAVLPPGVFTGQATFQDVTRVRPDDPRSPSPSNNVGFTVTKPTTKSTPIQPSPSIGYLPQRNIFPQSIPTTQRSTPTTTVIPFTDIYKPDKPVYPSPSDNKPQFVPLQPPHDCDKPKSPSSPFISNPTNQNPTFLKPYTQPTPKPLKKESFIPIIPFPSNNSPKTAFPPTPQPTQPPHDCNKPIILPSTYIPNPTNQNPSFVKPYSQPTPKPFKNDYSIPVIPFPSNNSPNIALPPKPQPTQPPHDCKKPIGPASTYIPNPTNPNPAFLKPYSQPTPKPYSIPVIPFPSNTSPNIAPPPKPKAIPPAPIISHNCDQHKSTFPPFFGNPTSKTPVAYKQPTFRPLEKPKVPEASNNIAQILAQPQQVSLVKTAPAKPSGYVYDKPAIPFPPPPTTPRPLPPTTPKPTTGYVYDPPRIPFASNNFAQVVSKPTTKQTADPPCDHHHHTPGELTNPTNQNVVVLTPSSTGDSYIYNKPKVPFPPETTGPSNQNPVNINPFVSTTQKPTTGYFYDPPVKQLLLPTPTNTFQRIASPTNNGYNYQKPEIPFPPESNLPTNNNEIFATQSTFKPFPTTSKPFTGYSYPQPSVPFPNINSKLSLPSESKPQYVAKPQTREEVTVSPGYSYNKPNVPFSTQPSSQNTAVSGYSYPKPSPPFPR